VDANATRAYLATLYLLGVRGQELASALEAAAPESARGVHLGFVEALNADQREARLQAVAPVLRALSRELEARSPKLEGLSMPSSET
jgi:hypothetical protein